MKIAAIFVDGTPGVINVEELELLLQKRGLQAFRRSDGWVRVGFDALRGSGNNKRYCGKNRRALDEFRPTSKYHLLRA
jgi:hypothetical protein